MRLGIHLSIVSENIYAEKSKLSDHDQVNSNINIFTLNNTPVKHVFFKKTILSSNQSTLFPPKITHGPVNIFLSENILINLVGQS